MKATDKLQFLKHACINCHPSMKAYYQGEYAKWLKICQTTKNIKK